MTPDQLHDLLDDFAATEIPDTMTILNDIEARLQTASPIPAARPILRFSRAFVVVFALMFATVAYAVYQAQLVRGDPGIMAVGAQELGTPLNLTQSLPDADVNLNLQWAYADGNRIAIAWEVEFAIIHNPAITQITLLDADGQPFEYADFLRGGGGGGGGGGERAAFGTTTSWDATRITGAPESLNLTVVIGVASENPITPPDISNAGGEGGEGGGGGGSSTEFTPFMPYEARFEITVPFISVATGAADPITVEAGDIPITVRNVRYAPSATIGLICLPVGFYPEYSLWLQREELRAFNINFSTEETPDVSQDGLTECYDFTILGIVADKTGLLRFTFERLVTNLPDMSVETFAAFQSAIEAEGLAATVTRTGAAGYETHITLVPPDDYDPSYNEQVNAIYTRISDLADEILHESIVGPWVFEIALK